jgi:nucleoid-associated protein YgaU
MRQTPPRQTARRRTLLPLAVSLLLLGACDLPDPPQPAGPRPTTLPLLAVTPAPTFDADATATTLAVPVTLTPTLTATPAPPTPETAEEGFERYVVQRGDTLAAIAVRFETTVDALVTLNELADPNAIEVGQELRVPAPVLTTP